MTGCLPARTGVGLVEALDLGHGSGHGAGADDDLVKAAADGAEIVDLGVEADLNAGLGDLSLVPGDELLVVLLEGHGGGREEQAAQLVFLLEDHGVVAALFQNQRALHAADAAADDRNLLGVLGRDDLVAVVLHGGRVQGAAAQVQGVAQGLHVLGAVGLGEVEAAVVAADVQGRMSSSWPVRILVTQFSSTRF